MVGEPVGVMTGEAMTAGSTPRRRAATGSAPPMSWESSTVHTSVRLTTSATGAAMRSSSSILPKLHTASVPPHKSATRSSRQSTRSQSRGAMSPTARPRMMVEVLWLPALPPVSVSIGI